MATYHVKKTGNDTTGDGSDSLPWLTIGKGVTVMTGGDTLEVHTGTYVETVTCSDAGSAGAPTIIQAHGTTGSYDVVTVAPTSGHGFYIPGKAYVTIRGFVVDGTTPATGRFGIRFDAASHNLIVEDCEVKNFCMGIIGAHTGTPKVGSNNVTIRRNSIHNNGVASEGQLDHGIYSDTGINWTIQYNLVYSNTGYGIHLYPGTTNSTVSWNICHDNAASDNGNGEANILVSNTGHTIERNICYGIGDAAGMGIRVQYGDADPANIELRHNTIGASGTYGIYIAAGCTGITLKNNLSVGSTTPISNNAGAGCVLTNNVTSGTPSALWTNSGAGDYTLKAGAAVLNTGTDIGQSFNGAAPDQGAAEAFVFLSASVENSATTTLVVNFTNNVTANLLPASSITGFTSKKNGSNNVITAASRSGNNTVLLTLTNAIAQGDTVLVSYSGGNLTDSSLFGYTINQPYIQTLTDQAVTNNVVVPDLAPAAPTGLTVV